ncbi:hypothetical protein MRB53_005902 [Persea americana]|uniref:Uncharacterized protein n=1 Tax=Persea americana TaxID=3435 RepID=A0ACC2MEN2_PERAE|nr:hypothetical protein MRB53_005902 [Persea americana]
MSLIFSKPGRALGKETSINLMHDAWEQMHRYILFNCTEVAPFVEEHRKKIYTNNRHKRQIDRERMHNDQFPKWFESHVDCLQLEGDKRVTTDLRLLARGPRTQERRTRGPNRCIALTNQRERIVIACNEYGQPIGRSERLLSSYVGIIARDGQKTPLTYSDWRRMPAERSFVIL